ncbi:hypothetical protein HJC23_006268 [Cyclotella cryptica]|uniref:Peptidase M12B domain-containing protein n=1 Tax=Cyclotella cryptica TaxID=29204 RepID=A0ABD3PKU2_9STRA|eukprot:CCRYP_013461-RA/>CCRYP_013461-RA protein AED:0.05 eAED:0.05 QI:303/1/1/1/1/1/4/392/1064
MKSLHLLLAMTIAASVHGQVGGSTERDLGTGSGEASSLRVAHADQRGDGVGVGAVFDRMSSDHDEVQPRIHVSQAENLLHILRNTEADRSSPLSPPLHFEIEVDLSNESDAQDEDLSHFRRLQTTPDAGAKESSTLLLQLSTATPAISPSTTYNFKSVSFPQNTPSDKTDIASKLSILVNDPAKTRGIAVLSVNTENGSVRGLQRGRSGSVRTLDMFTLRNGEVVEDAAAHMDARKRIFMSSVVGKGKNQNFTCGVEHKEEWDDRMLFEGVLDEGWKGVRGRLDEEKAHHHHHHHHDEHEHHHHDHNQRLLNVFSKTAAFKPSTDETVYSDEDGPGVRFQVNIVIDIDAEFIAKQGGPEEAIEYVNFLVTVANVILENEVGARLNVIRIQEINYFGSADTLRDGLRIMREQYNGKFPDGVQLRHALLGTYMGGGIAFIDAVCDDRYGVGLSSGLEGRIGSLDEDALYDLFIMVHEIGHSLGSDHTFESTAYKPVIDSCGLDACPNQLPLANSATIMSYCDFCDGGLSNVALSYGGVWTGDHPRLDLDNWKESPEVVDSKVSLKPERVSHQIWKTLYSKGQCILRPTDKPTSSPVSSSPTKQPITSFPTTSSPTPRPTTASPTSSSPSMRPTDSPTFNYGPFYLSPQKTCGDNCYLSRGIMFDVGLGSNATRGILIESISFEYTEPRFTNATVDLYRTFVGSYEDKVGFSAQWTQLESIRVKATHGTNVDVADRTMEISLDPPVAMSANDTVGFYLAASGSILRVGTGSNANFDSHSAFIGPGSTVMSSNFGIGVKGYFFNVDVKYAFMRPSQSPTEAPSKRPITFTPTVKVTAPPTKAPSITMKPTTKRPTYRNPSSGPTTRRPSDGDTGDSLFASPTVVTSTIATPTSKPLVGAPGETLMRSEPSFWLTPTSFCESNCLASSGFMFNVKLDDGASKILINSIQFDHLRGRSSFVVDVYTTNNGTLVGKQGVPNQWTRVSTVALPKEASTTTATIEPPISLSSGITRGFYLVAKEGILLVGFGSFNASDVNGASIEDGTVVFGQFGKSYSGYYLNARVGYNLGP